MTIVEAPDVPYLPRYVKYPPQDALILQPIIDQAVDGYHERGNIHLRRPRLGFGLQIPKSYRSLHFSEKLAHRVSYRLLMIVGDEYLITGEIKRQWVQTTLDAAGDAGIIVPTSPDRVRQLSRIVPD